MRIIVFILTLVCFFNLTANSVYIDTVYCNYYNNLVKQKQLIVNYKLKNISDEDYLTWVSITPVEKKSDRELVYEFFKQRKGDFSWLQMMYEGLLETQIMNVGYSFIKNIHPNETFSYYVCKIDKKSFFYEDRIVIIQKKKVEQYLKEKFDDKYFFQLPYIVLIDGKIESRILTDNGYAVPDSAGGYDYYYYVKDWQGNVRAVIDEANRRMELNNYYPYGMPMSSTASVQPYKYGGKELDRTNGLDMYDFHARHYDPAFPHFLSIDTNAENYPDISPYAYCYGNPINIIDPLGTDTVHVDFDGYQIDPIKQGGEDVMFVTSFPELVVTGSFPNSASDATINSTMIIIGGLVADDVTGVGIANDAAIPIVFTAGALVAGGQQIYEYFNPPEPVTTSYYSYKPAPKKLPAYPDATPVKNKAGRKRWRLGNGDTAEWDSLHGELEVYDRNGNHKGAFDPKNGKQLKPGKKNRKLKK